MWVQVSGNKRYTTHACLLQVHSFSRQTRKLKNDRAACPRVLTMPRLAALTGMCCHPSPPSLAIAHESHYQALGALRNSHCCEPIATNRTTKAKRNSTVACQRSYKTYRPFTIQQLPTPAKELRHTCILQLTATGCNCVLLPLNNGVAPFEPQSEACMYVRIHWSS